VFAAVAVGQQQGSYQITDVLHGGAQPAGTMTASGGPPSMFGGAPAPAAGIQPVVGAAETGPQASPAPGYPQSSATPDYQHGVQSTHNAPNFAEAHTTVLGGMNPHHMQAGNNMGAAVGGVMQNLLGSMAAASGGAGGMMQPAGQVSRNPFGGAALGQESTEVVSGLIEKFMHKVHLEDGERACLERNVAQVTGDIMGTVGDIVTAIKALVVGNGKIEKSQTGGLIRAGMDSAMKITSLVALITTQLKTCVHGDSLEFLKSTSKHLVDGEYLKHEILVNGVDIAHSLSDSIIAFEAHDFHRFGGDIGVALRKVLLSTNNKAVTLPEGVPEEKIIQKATDGLFRGFFTRGAEVDITDSAHPDVNIDINLHRCIAGNSEFFKEIWLAAWNLIAQLSANAQQHQMFKWDMSGSGGKQPKWAGELMVAMMQFPMALSKCGVSSGMQSMLMEAIQSLNDVHVQFQFPHDQFDPEDATKKMAKAVEAWTNFDFERFGYELGELFRELVMLAFPQQYSVDTSGRLQRYSKTQMLDSDKAGSFSRSVMIVAAAALFVMVSFAAVRSRRAVMSNANSQHLVDDLEDSTNAQEVE
jgi:hypothetical protein